MPGKGPEEAAISKCEYGSGWVPSTPCCVVLKLTIRNVVEYTRIHIEGKVRNTYLTKSRSKNEESGWSLMAASSSR